MINQSSIKYISSLLEWPGTLTDGDHGSIALFRQTFPYFVPARYIQAIERHRKSPFSAAMISEIQPYMGNWILLCDILEAGRKDVKDTAGEKINDKKRADIASFLQAEQAGSGEKKPVSKVPGFMQAANSGQQKQTPAQEVSKDINNKNKQEPVKPTNPETKVPPVTQANAPAVKVDKKEEPKPVSESMKVPPATSVTPEVKVGNKEYPKPVSAELKATPPMPPTVPEVRVDKKEEPKPVSAELKTTSPALPEVKADKKEELRPVSAELKATPPIPPIISEVKADKKEEPKLVSAELKATPPVPPAVPEVKVDKKEEPKPVSAELKATPPIPPVISEVKTEKTEEPSLVSSELKVTPVPSEVLPEVKVDKKEDIINPITKEIKITSTNVPGVIAKGNEGEVKSAEKSVIPPVGSVAGEVRAEEKEEVIKTATPEIKTPPMAAANIPEIKTTPVEEPVKPVSMEIKSAQPISPVPPETNAEKKEVGPMPVAIPAEKQGVFARFVPTKVTVDKEPEEQKMLAAQQQGAGIKLTPVKIPAEETQQIKEEAKISIDAGQNLPGTAAVPPVNTSIDEPVKEVIQETVVPEAPGEELKSEPAVQDLGKDNAPVIEDTYITDGTVNLLQEDTSEKIEYYVETVNEVTDAAIFPEDKLSEYIAPLIDTYDTEDTETATDDLIFSVYTEDYFLQQGLKVSDEIPGEIDELKEDVYEEDEEGKELMVMMSFSEWLMHFKNTSEKQMEEKKDQKALKTMWQKEKLAAAMEEENEEIPENVFEMAVNSITKEDGLASESLADIYIKQGKYDKAIEMYRKLSLRNPKKNAYFARRIEEVLKEKQS